MITVVYFIVGFLAAKAIDKLTEPFDKKKEEKEVTILETCVNIVFYLIITAIIVYILRNIVQLIPSPLEGLYKFQHLRVKELQSSQILIFSILYYQKNLQDKLKYLYKKL